MSNRLEVRAIVQPGTPDERTINLVGRNGWTLMNLVKSGPMGCSPIDQPAPRWSAYVFNLRQDFGLSIVTLHETHGGLFAGTHGRYVLQDDVVIVEPEPETE